MRYSVLCLLATLWATDAGGVPRVVSTNSNGDLANGPCISPVVSPTGRFIAFTCLANNLTPVSEAAPQLYLKDLETGSVELVSQSNDGSSGNRSSIGRQVSTDGRYVFFSSDANNLVPGDTNDPPATPDAGGQDLFIRDVLIGETRRVSLGPNDSELPSGTAVGFIDDGITRVVFRSLDELFPPDGERDADIFRRDIDTGETLPVNTFVPNQVSAGGAEVFGFSADGNRVYLASSSAFLSSDTNGAFDLYKKDLTTGIYTRLVFDQSGEQLGGIGFQGAAVASVSSNFIAFSSGLGDLADALPGQLPGVSQVYLVSCATPGNRLISVNGTVAGNGNSMVSDISGAGDRVTFRSSANNLGGQDANGLLDVFLYDHNTGAVTLLSATEQGASGNAASQRARISRNGRFVVFESEATNLGDGIPSGTGPQVYVVDLGMASAPQPVAVSLGGQLSVCLGLAFLLSGLVRLQRQE